MHKFTVDIFAKEPISHLFFDEFLFIKIRIERIKRFQVVLLQEDLLQAFADLRRISKARAAHTNEQRASFLLVDLEFFVQILGQFPDLDGRVFLNRYKRLNIVAENFLLFLIKDRSGLILVSSGGLTNLIIDQQLALGQQTFREVHNSFLVAEQLMLADRFVVNI